jgi:ketosteroid isomerase-like protein
MQNVVEIVKGLYESFGRGDIPAILDQMSPDVDWDYAQSADVPWLRPRRGPEGVAAFFAAVASGIEFRKFLVKEIFASADGRVAVALVDVEAVAKVTGRPIAEEDEIHLWRFGANGKIVRFRHGVDSFRHLEALRGT